MTGLASSYTYMYMCNTYTSTDINTQVHIHTHLRAVWGHGTCAQRYGVNCGVCIFRIHWPMPRKCAGTQTIRCSLSLTTKACVHPHICSNSCLTKVKDNLQTYFLKKGCGTSVETERNVIYVLGSQQFCTASKK